MTDWDNLPWWQVTPLFFGVFGTLALITYFIGEVIRNG